MMEIESRSCLSLPPSALIQQRTASSSSSPISHHPSPPVITHRPVSTNQSATSNMIIDSSSQHIDTATSPPSPLKDQLPVDASASGARTNVYSPDIVEDTSSSSLLPQASVDLPEMASYCEEEEEQEDEEEDKELAESYSVHQEEPVPLLVNGFANSEESDAVASPSDLRLKSGDLESSVCNSPMSSDVSEKQRSRRKPTLEDIVRRMKTVETSYASDESDGEVMNGHLSIDINNGMDEVDGSADVAMETRESTKDELMMEGRQLMKQELLTENHHQNLKQEMLTENHHHQNLKHHDLLTENHHQNLKHHDLLTENHHMKQETLAENRQNLSKDNMDPSPKAAPMDPMMMSPRLAEHLESKENHPIFQSPNVNLLSSFPMASNISETAFSPHVYATPKLNNWFPGSFNGLPLFPFSPGPIDHSFARKFLPFDSKIAAEVEKDYLKCQYCERTFRRQKNLENHIENTHHGKSPVRRRENGTDMYFKCTHCPYTTKHQSNLYVHLRIHTGERPYICGACGVQYSQSHSLKSHIINKHDGIMSYYIKEKRTRSPRGMGYLTHIIPDSQMFKMPSAPGMVPGLASSLDLAKPLDISKSTMDSMSPLWQKSSPQHYMLNGHASPNYGDVPASRSPPGALQQQFPSNSRSVTTTPTTFSSSNQSPMMMMAQEDSCGAIDLSKKSMKEQLLTSLCNNHDNGNLSSSSPFHGQSLCSNCLHGNKLKMLRKNVVRMLSILVPNLNFEEKGISADSDSVDELLQDVIESNIHEEDME